MTGPAWDAPGNAGPEFDPKEHVGQLAFAMVGGLATNIATAYGVRDAVRCTFVILTGPSAGREYDNCLMFGSKFVSRLRGSVGRPVLGYLRKNDTRGGNVSVDFEDPGALGQGPAQAWWQAHPTRAAELIAKCQNDHVQAELKAEQAKFQQANQPQQGQQQWGAAPQGYPPPQQAAQQWAPQPTPVAAAVQQQGQQIAQQWPTPQQPPDGNHWAQPESTYVNAPSNGGGVQGGQWPGQAPQAPPQAQAPVQQPDQQQWMPGPPQGAQGQPQPIEPPF
jgi:hypothetical protein